MSSDTSQNLLRPIEDDRLDDFAISAMGQSRLPRCKNDRDSACSHTDLAPIVCPLAIQGHDRCKDETSSRGSGGAAQVTQYWMSLMVWIDEVLYCHPLPQCRAVY
jgi:hypothetical protein